MNRIARLLKDTREDLDLSQLDVMEKTGISNKSLSRYENDITEPDIETLATLFGLYGLSLDSALGLRSEGLNQLMMSPEERKMLRQLRTLPPQMRDMIFSEVETLTSFQIKEKK